MARLPRPSASRISKADAGAWGESWESQGTLMGVSCNIQKGKRVCDQKRKGSEDGAMEQNDGFGAGVWGMAEVIDVAVRTQATKDPGTGWHIHRESLGADGDFGVIADAA